MVGWHHWLNGHEQAPGVSDGQGSLACCSPRGLRVRHDWDTELNWIELYVFVSYTFTWIRAVKKDWIYSKGASLVAQMVKNLSVMQETQVQSLGWEDPLENGMATHSSILAWSIPWTEEPCGLQSIGLQRVRHGWVTNTHTHTHTHTHIYIYLCTYCNTLETWILLGISIK